jgi:hypothetical protein
MINNQRYELEIYSTENISDCDIFKVIDNGSDTILWIAFNPENGEKEELIFMIKDNLELQMLIVSTFTIDEHSFKEMYKLAHTK